MPPRAVLRLVPLIALLAEAGAAVYAGMPATYRQADGAGVPVRLFGDEFWAVAETADGFTVARDAADRRLCYAVLAPDGGGLASSGVAVEAPPPAGLARHLRPPAAMAAEQSRARRQALGVDARGRLTRAMRTWLRGGGRRPVPGLAGSGAGIRPAAAAAPLPAAARSAPPLAATAGRRCAVLLLARFPDHADEVAYAPEEVDAYANDPGYTGGGNATSVRSYFAIQSEGRLDYANSVTAYFTAAHQRGYYTDPAVGFGLRARELINEGLAVLRAQDFDFAACDADGDGVVDAVNLLYAGATVNDWSEGLWPHQWTSTWSAMPAPLSANFGYQISDMPPSGLLIGTFCHESGHLIADLPDLYPINGNPADVGDFCLMSTGNYADEGRHPTGICGYLKLAAGWGTAIDIAATDHLVGATLAGRNLFWRYRNPALPEEYFLLESRSGASGYEGPFGGSAQAVAPARGLLIFHCREDGSNTDSTIRDVDVPDCSLPYELMLVESQRSDPDFFLSPDPDPSDGYHADAPLPATTASDATVPALRFWSAHGRATGSGLVVREVGAAAPAMRFTIGAGAVDGGGGIGVSDPAGIAVACDAGSDAAARELLVWNRGTGVLAISLAGDRSWLLPPAAPDADGRGLIRFATAGLPPGSYSGTVTVSATGAATVAVPVVLTVRPAAILAVHPAAVAAAVTAGAAAWSASATLRNIGGGSSRYTVASDAAWLRPGRSGGLVAGEQDAIPYAVDPGALAVGVHRAVLTIGDGASTASGVVTLTVAPAGAAGGGGSAGSGGAGGGGGGGCGAGGLAALLAGLAAWRRRRGPP